MEIERKSKRKLRGTIVSTKMAKTIVVKVNRRYKHPVYSKFINSSKKYHAHDEHNIGKIGEVVTIIESSPFSKLKKWELYKAKS